MLSCHLGVSRTISLLSQHFWWPSNLEDVKELFLPALSLPAKRFPEDLLKVCSSRYWYRIVTGPTYPWILSLHCLPQRVRWLCSQLLTTFRRSISLPCLISPTTVKQWRLFCCMFSGSMVSPGHGVRASSSIQMLVLGGDL